MTRINTNVSALIASNTLQGNMTGLEESLTRLSTGLRINSGKDDPAGLIASELLRSDITAIERGISNSERANQVISTADSALGQVSRLLNDIRGLVVEAANTGAMSAEQIAANQLQVDSSLEAIDRIAKVTTFQGKRLLDGSLDFVTEGVNTNQIQDLKIDQANFGTTNSVDVNVEVVSVAERGKLSFDHAAVADDVVLEVGGNKGFEAFNFDTGSTIEEMAAAINLVSDSTGVAAEVSNDATNAEMAVTSANKNAAVDLTVNTAGDEGNYVDVKVVASKSGSTNLKWNESADPTEEHSTLVIEAAAKTWTGASATQVDDTNITDNSTANITDVKVKSTVSGDDVYLNLGYGDDTYQVHVAAASFTNGIEGGFNIEMESGVQLNDVRFIASDGATDGATYNATTKTLEVTFDSNAANTYSDIAGIINGAVGGTLGGIVAAGGASAFDNVSATGTGQFADTAAAGTIGSVSATASESIGVKISNWGGADFSQVVIDSGDAAGATSDGTTLTITLDDNNAGGSAMSAGINTLSKAMLDEALTAGDGGTATVYGSSYFYAADDGTPPADFAGSTGAGDNAVLGSDNDQSWDLQITSQKTGAEFDLNRLNVVLDSDLTAGTATASWDDATQQITLRYNASTTAGVGKTDILSAINAIENSSGEQLFAATSTDAAIAIYAGTSGDAGGLMLDAATQKVNTMAQNAMADNALDITAKVAGEQFNDTDVHIVAGAKDGSYGGINNNYALASSSYYGEGGVDAMFKVSAVYGGAYSGEAASDLQISFTNDTNATSIGFNYTKNSSSVDSLVITGDLDNVSANDLVQAYYDLTGADATEQADIDEMRDNIALEIDTSYGGDGTGAVGADMADDNVLGQTGRKLGYFDEVAPVAATVNFGATDANDTINIAATKGGMFDGVAASLLNIEMVDHATTVSAELDLQTNTLTLTGDFDHSGANWGVSAFNGHVSLIDADGNSQVSSGDISDIADYVTLSTTGNGIVDNTSPNLITGMSLQAAVNGGGADVQASQLGTGDPNRTLGVGASNEAGVTIEYREDGTAAVASVVGKNNAGDDSVALKLTAANVGSAYNDVAVQFFNASGVGKTVNTAEYDATSDPENKVLKVYVEGDGGAGTTTWSDVVSAINNEGTFTAEIDTNSGLSGSGADVVDTSENVTGAPELGNTGKSGAEAGALMMYVQEGVTSAADAISALGETWNAQANALFSISSSEDNDGTGMLFQNVHSDALTSGTDGGEITATAEDIINAINADTSLSTFMTAANGVGSLGIGKVTAFEESAYYGSAVDGTGLQFLAPEDARDIQFVANAGESLSVETKADTLGQAKATLGSENANAAMVFTATQEGEAYDDVVVRFKAAQGGVTNNTVTYQKEESAAQAYLTFTDLNTKHSGGMANSAANTNLILNANTHGDEYNNVSVKMRFQKDDGTEDNLFKEGGVATGSDLKYTLSDGSEVTAKAIAQYDETNNELVVILKGTDATAVDTTNAVNTTDIMRAIDQEGTFSAELDYANATRLNTGEGSGFGSLVDAMTSGQPELEGLATLGNTGTTGGHEGGVLEFTLAAGSSTAADVIDTLSNDVIASKSFSALGLDPTAIDGNIDFHEDTNKAITSGGLVEQGAMVVHLETDENGLVQTTAKDLVDYWATLTPAENDGVSVGLWTEPTQAGETSASDGSGLLSATTTDIAFSTSGMTPTKDYSSGTVDAVNGVNASYTLSAKKKGSDYDGIDLVYVMDAADTSSISVDYDSDNKVLTVHAHQDTTAEDVEQLIESDDVTKDLFSVVQQGTGKAKVTVYDQMTTSGGLVDAGTASGAQFINGADAENTSLSFVSEEYGSDQFVSVKAVQGDFDVVDASGNSKERDYGADVNARLNGIAMIGEGLNASINTNVLDLSFNVGSSVKAGDTLSFSVTGGGATFQMGPEVVSNQQSRLGIQSVSTATLGGASGRLFQLRSGQAFSLTGDVGTAAQVVDEVITEVTSLRGRLGAFQRTTVDTNIASLTDTLEALTAAESSIRDTDFATETTALTRSQILVQSGVSVLGIAKQNPNMMLNLLR